MKKEINVDKFYKMLISSDVEMQQLGFGILESFFPLLSSSITPAIYSNPEIIQWFCDLGFENKKARIVYAVYKIAKFKTKII